MVGWAWLEVVLGLEHFLRAFVNLLRWARHGRAVPMVVAITMVRAIAPIKAIPNIANNLHWQAKLKLRGRPD